jgi:large conductance mechanosensitive channel
MLQDFRDFILRGNVVDLAVAVVIGAAFGAVVTSMVEGLITPLIAAIGGQPDFSALDFTINGSTFRYGLFLNALISFLVIAAAVFFLVVVPVNKLMAMRKTETAADAPTRECPECLSSIPAGARRCAFCTSEVGAAAV